MPSLRFGRSAPWIFGTTSLFVVVACSSAPEAERTGESSSAIFTNAGFETGTTGAAPPSWTVTPYLNPGITVQTPQTIPGLDLATAITGHAAPIADTVIMDAPLGAGTLPDALLGLGASLRWPRYGNKCALVNSAGKNQNVNVMSQTMTIGASDVDPLDKQIHVRFVVAPVLEDPGHPANEQPYFAIQLTNTTRGNAVLYSNFNFSNQPGVPWKNVKTATTTYDYTDWQLVDIAPGSPAINAGDKVQLELIAAGCSLGGHEGQLYVDGVGESIPDLFVSGTAAAQVNACSNLTYTLKYENGLAATAAGVKATFNIPPNTTFQSVTETGLTCTTPAKGATTGAVVCTIGTVAAGAGGSFQVTVNVPCGTTGTITAGNYFIAATAVEPLLGPVVNTVVGCTADAQCASGNWCNETGNVCTPTLANGVALPTDAAHMNPTLNGTCSAPVGTLVCTSAVCDTDKKCGLANADGPCTVADGATVCRSAVCDPDLHCGYNTGHGPCSAANAATVCRSGTCSTNLTCEPVGGCNADADCTGGKWCDEATHVCTAPLADGTPIPNDPTHTAPTLNGKCSAAAAKLVCLAGACEASDNECGLANGDGPCVPGATVVCRSGVCDTDKLCGYGPGNGPCTAGDAATVCRSGVCNASMTCKPATGCVVDADCGVGSGKWCDEAAHTCTAQLPNGTPIPTDPTHTGPTLNGKCTAAAGTLVCASGVCDMTDNECGYATGDGPCTTGDAVLVCRTGMCNTGVAGGVCEPSMGCNTDSDCTGGAWCNEAMHLCTAPLANGTPVPTDPTHTSPTLDGTCTAAAGILVCASGACDAADNECGVALGDGPCASTTQCRTGQCVGGTCVQCATDSDCSSSDYCNAAGACTPKAPDGDTCTQADQCISGACANATCGTTQDAGAATDASEPTGTDASEPTGTDASAPPQADDGFSMQGGGCSVSQGSAGGSPPALGVGLLLGGIALGRSRRRRSAPTATRSAAK
jgi:hypothetical protein